MTPEQQAAIEAAQARLAEQQKAVLADLMRQAGMPTGDVPEGMFLNPETGQMTSRELLKNNVPVSRGMAAVGGAMQGTGFQFGDELIGKVLSGGDKDMETFQRERARATLEANREAYPGTSIGSEIAGGVSSAIATAPLAAAQTGLGAVLRGGLLGAGEGALYGAGRGEEGTRGDTAVNDMIIGGLLGGAAPIVVGGARRALNLPGNVYSSVKNKPDQARANKLLAETLERAGMTPDQVADAVAAAQRVGQPEFRAMDALGDAGARRASGIANSGNRAAQEITEFLASRQTGQAERLAQFVEQAFDTGGDTAAQRAAKLTAARRAAADVAYDAARANAQPVDVRGALAVIDDRIGPMQGSGVAGDGIDGLLSKFRNRLAAADPKAPNTAVELSDFNRVLGVKQDVQDAIGAAVRAGRNNEARELGKVMAELDAALEAASPAYRAANDDFARASRIIDSIEAGQQMARPGARAADNVQAFGAMTPEQQAAARVGYADKALGKIEANSSPTANKAKPFTSQKVQEEIKALARNPQEFMEQIGNETRMWETLDTALGNSTTARKQVDIREVTEGSEGVLSAFKDVGNFSFGNAAAKLLQPVMDAATGVSDETRVLLARALMSDNPREAMNIALRQQMDAATRQRLIEAIARSTGLRAIASQ